MGCDCDNKVDDDDDSGKYLCVGGRSAYKTKWYRSTEVAATKCALIKGSMGATLGLSTSMRATMLRPAYTGDFCRSNSMQLNAIFVAPKLQPAAISLRF